MFMNSKKKKKKICELFLYVIKKKKSRVYFALLKREINKYYWKCGYKVQGHFFFTLKVKYLMVV